MRASPSPRRGVWRLVFTFPRPPWRRSTAPTPCRGWILGCACDYRVMARPAAARWACRSCARGVTFPPIKMLVAVRFLTPAAVLQAMVFAGRTYDGEQALRAGLVEEAVPPDELLPRALAVAQEMARLSPAAFQVTKQQLRKPFVERAEAAARVSGELHAQWAGADTAEAIRAYLGRVLGKGGGG